MTSNKILAQGAEAIIYLIDNKKSNISFEQSSDNQSKNLPSSLTKLVLKKRISKSYRIPEIDKSIIKLRTRHEEKILRKLSKEINVPKLFQADENTGEIFMEFLQGDKLANTLDNYTKEKQKSVCKEIGKQTAKMHSLEIIHNDLTTSNMILVPNSSSNKKPQVTYIKNNVNLSSSLANSKANGGKGSEALVGGKNKKQSHKLFFIDFGLSYYSARNENKAVDLHLLKQALEAKHFKNWKELWKYVQQGYNSKNKEKAKLVLQQLEKVEKRGRYKG